MSIWFDFGVDWKIRGYEFVVYQMCGRSLYELVRLTHTTCHCSLLTHVINNSVTIRST